MPEISIKAEHLFDLWGIPISNSILLSVVTLAILVLTSLILGGRMKEVPGKIQSMFELLIEYTLSMMDTIFGRRDISERYFPLIASVFLFVLVSNWLGLLPIVGPLEFGHYPLLRSPAADLNFTLALAIIAVFSVNMLSAMALGIRKYVGRFVHPKDPVMSFVGGLEIISEFVKIVSFSFRLFGNVFAGEVLLIIVGSLVPLVVPLPFMFLEVFVGFIQAFIFAMLTMVFIAGAVAEPEH